MIARAHVSPVTFCKYDSQLNPVSDMHAQSPIVIKGIMDHKIHTMSLTQKKAFTYKQGQYLAFIHYYTKVNGMPPHRDLQRYFRVSPPSVHRMVTQFFIKPVSGNPPQFPALD